MSNQYAYNKRAKFDYELLKTYEAGIKLRGYEVKSIKNNTASLQGSFVIIRAGEAYITNMQVPPYQEMNMPADYDVSRPRKLLLHRSEIEELERKLQQKGLTLVPIKLYNKGGNIKVEFAVAKGKKKGDKRQTIKKREDERKMRRSLKNRTDT